MQLKNELQLLTDAADKANNWHEIGTELREQVLDSPNNPLWGYIYAFEYFFVDNTNEEYKSRYGDYAPWIEFANGQVFPPPLSTLEIGFLQSWNELIKETDHPILCSRLNDLLWVKKFGNKPYKFAINAIEDYLRLFKEQNNWNEIDKTFCLLRALDLALQINNQIKIANITQKIVDSCLDSLAAPESKPGVTIRLLDSLLSLNKKYQPQNLAEIIKRCLQVYEANSWVLEQILIRQLKFIGDDDKERKPIQERHISLLITNAERSTGLSYSANLQSALEFARNYGFSEKAEELRRRIQEIPEESFGLQEVSVTTHIKNETIEKFLQSYISEENWSVSFSRFGKIGPPSGNYESNQLEIGKQLKESPLRFLVTNIVYDDNNAPIYVSDNFDDNKNLALNQSEKIYIETFAVFAPEIISRINKVNGIPNLEELIGYFTTSIIPVDIAENIAIAFEWYFKEEYDISAHLIIPRIESIIRILASKLGFAVIREPIGDRAGGVLTLGELLNVLHGRMDESWRRYLINLLVKPVGVNLRNRICHGLITRVNNREAALLLQVVCFLRSLEIQNKN